MAGKAVFGDVLRRADKNDNGTVCLEEFKSFFADGVLSEAEFTDLFNKIDKDHSGSIDVTELCEYFTSSSIWGHVDTVFNSIDTFNSQLLATLQASAQAQSADLYQQFALRFLLKEVTNQLRSLAKPVHEAVAALTERAASARPTVMPHGASITAEIAFDNKGSAKVAAGSDLSAQVQRLAGLLDRLSGTVKFDLEAHTAEVESESDQTAFLVRRKLVVAQGKEGEFLAALKEYAVHTRAAAGAVSLSVRHVADSHVFLAFEVWSSQSHYKSHFQSDAAKRFRLASVDALDEAAAESTLEIPSQWL